MTTTDRALRILAQRPLTAGELGQQLWTGRCDHKSCGPGACSRIRRGRLTSVNGGGDYAAQMLLGRMRKAGLVRGALPSADYQRGATVWVLTAKGKKEAEALKVVARFKKSVWF